MKKCAVLLLLLCARGGEAALQLTELINAGNFSAAKDSSKVTGAPFFANVTSYSGFLTVTSEQDRNLFFWFFTAEDNAETAPLIVWQQGGPGQSGLIGALEQIGPYRLKDNVSLEYNPHTWTTNFSILFLDSPVGTGFSWAANVEQGYRSTVQEARDDLYTALVQFFTLFSEFQSVPVYLSGESYGGKVQIALLEKINSLNPSATVRINIQGMFLLSAVFDPSNQVLVRKVVYELGLVGSRYYNTSKTLDQEYLNAIQQENYLEADRKWFTITRGLMTATKYMGFSDALDSSDPIKGLASEVFVSGTEVRDALHVGSATFSGTSDFQVRRRMKPDIMRSVRPALEQLLDSYRVLFIQGMFDLIVPPANNAEIFHNLTFGAQAEYQQAEQTKLLVEGEVAGYVKSGGNLRTVVVRNAGHYITVDQPRWCQKVVLDFVNNQ